MSARITKGLYRFCGELWDKNHREKCAIQGKLSAIFAAQGEASEESKEEEEQENIIALGKELLATDAVQISLNALKGIAGGQTLQSKGIINNSYHS